MYGALDISTSGMIAQRIRLDVVTANTANQGVVRDASGNLNPYRRRDVLLASGGGPGGPGTTPFSRALGVRVAGIRIDQSPPTLREYNPSHPDAYTEGPYKGYVARSNVNPVMEQVNALEATRSYEANVSSAEATKQMLTAMLRLIG